MVTMNRSVTPGEPDVRGSAPPCTFVAREPASNPLAPAPSGPSATVTVSAPSSEPSSAGVKVSVAVSTRFVAWSLPVNVTVGVSVAPDATATP